MMEKNLIYKVSDEALLQRCFDDLKLKRNEYSHNSDIWHLSHNWDTELPKIISELLSGSYRIEPAYKFYTEGSNSEVTIWSARDTVVLDALKTVLEGRIRNILNLLKEELSIFDIDMNDYYDNIDHRILINKIKKITDDKIFQDLILQYITAAIIEQGEYSQVSDVGIPSGNGLSSILKAIYFYDMDKLIVKSNESHVKRAA